MSQVLAFGDVLDAADQLSAEDQQELIAILQRRLADAGRERLLANINQARREFAAGFGLGGGLVMVTPSGGRSWSVEAVSHSGRRMIMGLAIRWPKLDDAVLDQRSGRPWESGIILKAMRMKSTSAQIPSPPMVRSLAIPRRV